MVSKCISKLGRSWPWCASLSLLEHALQMDLWVELDLGLQVHLQTRSITAAKYIFQQRLREYGDTGVMEVDWTTGSVYSGDSGVHSHHLIFISSHRVMRIHTLSFPTFGLPSSFRDFGGSTQLCGFSRQGSIISSHPLPTPLVPELLFLMDSVWMSLEVRWSVDGRLSAFQLRRFTTTPCKWCISKFHQWASPGAPPIMLDCHLRPDWSYVYIERDLNNACHIIM